MTEKRPFNSIITIRNHERLDQAVNNKICLFGNYLTKASIIDIALDLFFIELEENGITEIALKTLQDTE